MWYEIVPASALVAFFCGLPNIIIAAGNYVLHGTPSIRQTREDAELIHWRRDCAMAPDGNGHRTFYLDALPNRNPDGTPLRK